MDETIIWREAYELPGEYLLAMVRNIIQEGDVQRIFLKDENRITLLEIPLTAGGAATALTATIAPIMVAIGALAAVVSRVTVVVERRELQAHPVIQPVSQSAKYITNPILNRSSIR